MVPVIGGYTAHDEKGNKIALCKDCAHEAFVHLDNHHVEVKDKSGKRIAPLFSFMLPCDFSLVCDHCGDPIEKEVSKWRR